MRVTLYNITIVVATTLVLVSCSPEIAIVHRDHTHQRVRVTIDKNKTKHLDFGDDVSVNVSRGEHLVEAIPEGKTECPWTDDGKGWIIWVDKNAILTLLPPASVPAGEERSASTRFAGNP